MSRSSRTLSGMFCALAITFAGILVSSLAAALVLPANSDAAPSAKAKAALHYGSFGELAIYEPKGDPEQVVLFISGEGGWSLGVNDMAKTLADLGSLVVGVDIPRYLRNSAVLKHKCLYPAGDFEELSKFIQQTYKFPHYSPPLVVGFSSGAALSYALLAQAPPSTFRGALSLGFCPELNSPQPLCTGRDLHYTLKDKVKGYRLEPSAKLENGWVVLQGERDEVCGLEATKDFVAKTAQAQMVSLPKIGHEFSDPDNWMPQFIDSFLHLTHLQEAKAAPALPESVADLPLVEVLPADATPQKETLAIIVSGDGGWANIDKELGEVFSARGIPVVGINSLEYFWSAKSKDQIGADLTRVLRFYLSSWKKKRALLVGFSLGANVLPFMASRLPKDLLDQATVLALIAPEKKATFEFHLTDWLTASDRPEAEPLLPELEKLKGRNVLCLGAADEDDGLCNDFPASLGAAKIFPGGHHFGGDYEGLANYILSAAHES